MSSAAQIRRSTCLIACAVVGLLSGRVEADIIKLANGGELRGQLQAEDPARPQTITIVTLAGSRITVARDSVELVARRSLKIEQYELRESQLDGSLGAHLELAEWCAAQKLDSQRVEQLQNVLSLKPDHAEAHRLLGHRLVDGEWLTQDEVMQLRGFVRYRNRYVTPEERDLLEKTAEQLNVEREWFRKVRLWHTWLEGRHPNRRVTAIRELRDIRSPAAVPALQKNFQDSQQTAVRNLYVEVLKGIPGPEATVALVRQSLFDTDHIIRYEALNGLRPAHYDDARPHYVDALRNKLNPVVLRAAVALGRIGKEEDVPDLIEALVTRHQYRIRIPENNAMTFSTDASYGQRGLNPQLAQSIRSGAFPNGVIVRQPQQPVIQTRPALLTKEHQNREVLESLQKLTSQDFGFSERDWRLWWSSRKSGLISDGASE